MTPDNSTNQSGNFVIGVVNRAKGPINVSTDQSYTAQFESLVREIDGASASDAAKAEAKSLLKRFLDHPIVAGVVGGLASTLKL